MEFCKEEPLDLSASGKHSLRQYSPYPQELHVPGMQPSSVWTKPRKREAQRLKSVRSCSASPTETNFQLHQYPVTIKSEPITSLHGFYPCMPSVSYPIVSPHGVTIPPQNPDWVSYPSSPEGPSISQVHEASASPQRKSVSPQLGYGADDDNLANDPEFQNFRNDAVRAMAERNGGHLVGHNPRMRRTVQSSQEVDDEYRRQRERNNFAAKQSRDRRKLREIESSLKVCFLQRKLEELKALLAANKCGQCRRPCV